MGNVSKTFLLVYAALFGYNGYNIKIWRGNFNLSIDNMYVYRFSFKQHDVYLYIYLDVDLIWLVIPFLFYI